MKKIFLFLFVISFYSCSKEYDDSLLMDKFESLENRVVKLEELCKQMNSNISSLESIVNVLQTNDYITSITPIIVNSEEIGYTIAFKNNQPITIFHGKDGSDGKDGFSPIVGIKKDIDGHYYWTLNGNWLLDENNQKITAEGKAGESLPAPKLKIENGKWYVSYDNGQTWKFLGQATGDKGEQGDKGESMFRNIIVNEQYVIFILNDGSEFKLPILNNSHVTIDLNEPGTLEKVLTSEQKRDAITLKIKGEINAKDIRTIDLQLFNLEKIDLSESFSKELVIQFRTYKPLLQEIILPKFNKKYSIGIFSGTYPYFKKCTFQSDSVFTQFSHKVDTIVYKEGMTMTYSRSCCANTKNIVLPSTLKQVHVETFGFGSDEQKISTFNVTCFAINPPQVGDWHYYDNVLCFVESKSDDGWQRYAKSCTLYVPAESVELYKNKYFWKQFGKILPI